LTTAKCVISKVENYRLVRKSNQPFLVLKAKITNLQFGNIKYRYSSEFPLIPFKTKNDISVTFKTKNG
jgi:hypothetical protein